VGATRLDDNDYGGKKLMKPGRRPTIYPCPLCDSDLTRLGNSAYFRCSGCQKPFILEAGQLRQTRGRRGRLAGVKVKQEWAGSFLSAEEYERLVG